ncbi:MAG: MBOAT family O-acyltransferase [Planctomycetota bacterium]
MDGTAWTSLVSLADAARGALVTPLLNTPWGDVRDFWLGRILDDRFLVIYFLPLMFVLRPVPIRWLRLAIIVTSFAFITYLFGILYAGLWLLTCVGLFHLAERFAIECRRTDVWKYGPPLAVGAIVGGWYVVTMSLHNVRLPEHVGNWLFEDLRWIYPLGARGWAWEPDFPRLHDGRPGGPAPQLVQALFWDVHIVGTAYLAVRMFQYLSELKRDTIPRTQRRLVDFLAWVCYGPTLIQGPIERYAEFNHQIDTCHERRSWREVPPAVFRIAWGVGKSVVSTLYFQPVLWSQLGVGNDNRLWRHPEQIESFGLLYCGVFLVIFTLYLEFSGYCDVAIGMSRLLGYRVIENFRMPWRATSLRDFWRRWHISLSAILRDYVYIPLGGNRRRTLRNLLITFFLIGIWHRLIAQVALWGLLMGLLVWINQRWAQWIKTLDQQSHGPLPALLRAVRRTRPLPTIAAWLLTQHAFVFSLLVFFGGWGAITVPREILRRIWQWLST